MRCPLPLPPLHGIWTQKIILSKNILKCLFDLIDLKSNKVCVSSISQHPVLSKCGALGIKC